MDYAHRHELTPGFSPDDDIPDPYVPGEVPGREWIVPQRRSRTQPKKQDRQRGDVRPHPPADRSGPWQAAATKWLRASPQGTNAECQRALRLAGHENVSRQLIARLRAGMPAAAPAQGRQQGNAKPTPDNDRRSAPRSGRRRHHDTAPWHAFATRWLRANPGASNRQWMDAIEEAGFVGVTRKAVSALRSQMPPIRSKSKRAAAPQPAQPPVQVTRTSYCDGCGMAVTYDGRCRC